jgi:hypothetical protein
VNHDPGCFSVNYAGTDPSGTVVFNYVRCTGEFLDESEGTVTAIATIVIAAFTCTLWIATSQQAQLTREAFIADKRAFVFASGVQAIYEPDVGTGHFNWRVMPIWLNSGDTSTRNLQLYSDCFLSNAPIPANFDFNYTDPIQGPGTGMLGPKVSSAAGQSPHIPHQPALTPQDILDIQNGRKFFYLWGWARYSDGMPGTPPRISRYCWRISAAGNPLVFNPLVDPNGVRFINIHERRGNCADEECALQGLG